MCGVNVKLAPALALLTCTLAVGCGGDDGKAADAVVDTLRDTSPDVPSDIADIATELLGGANEDGRT